MTIEKQNAEPAQVENPESQTNNTESENQNLDDQQKQEKEPKSEDKDKLYDEKDPKWYQKRMDKMAGKYHSAMGENKILRERIAAFEAKESAGAKPTRDQFADDEEYAEAFADWKGKQGSSGQTQKSETNQHDNDDWNERIEAAQEQYDDWDDAQKNLNRVKLPMNVYKELSAAIMESEIGEHLMYALGKDKDFLKSLAGMSPARAAAAIGRLETRVEAELAAKKKPPVKASKAPEPIEPVGSRNGGKQKEWADMTPEEWAKFRGYKK